MRFGSEHCAHQSSPTRTLKIEKAKTRLQADPSISGQQTPRRIHYFDVTEYLLTADAFFPLASLSSQFTKTGEFARSKFASVFRRLIPTINDGCLTRT
jgi:hypothetical protein